jgi:uncharacterized protein YbcC (UPF0753/DUF2309 family)
MLKTKTDIAASSSDQTDIEALIVGAGRIVPPLWPLESAIAVNPLAGFEHRPFEEAVGEAAALFGAQPGLAAHQWQALVARGDIAERSLRDAAIEFLGGLDRAFELIGPDISRLDLLMARLEGSGAAEVEPALRSAAAHRFADAEPAPSRCLLASPCERAGGEILGYARAFVAKWCGAFFDQGIASSGIPYRELGLYPAVLKLAAYDPDFWRFAGNDAAALIASAESDPAEAVRQGLKAMGLEGANGQELLKRFVARLPGWAGHIRWRSEHGDAALNAEAPAGTADYLALWLLVERACALRDWPEAQTEKSEAVADKIATLAAQVGLDAAALKSLPVKGAARLYQAATLPDWRANLIWVRAAELTYRDRLVPQMERAAQRSPHASTARPDAQLVFCIDVRSEPFRRAIESQGAYETFGYAGFFGLPIAVRPGCGHSRAQLPVLLQPAFELPLEAAGSGGASKAARDERASAIRETVAMLKSGAATAFATAEALGPVGALASAARTLAPRLVRRWSQRPDADCAARIDAMPLQARIEAARVLFAVAGIPRKTARVVLLAGHGGEAVNNPYAAALDCGACGGHAGGVNARAMTAILNDPAVRAALADDGEPLPQDTVFLAGEHNTTTDEVTVFDLDLVPATHRDEAARLIADLHVAGAANRERRGLILDWMGDGAFSAAAHWGEVRPEWGLARNAAFIVGPRSLTHGTDLQGRAFLHSYDWRNDDDNSALALILTAPMVVAQWINGQYLFSTLDNARWGAGDKATHNVMGAIGVVQGNGGDLSIGLPYQSLFADDGTPYHVPQRLLTVVYAPLSMVEAVIEGNELRRLFGNGWVQLVVIDPATGKAKRWRTDAELPPETEKAPG